MNVVLVGGAGDGRRLILPDGYTRYELAVYEQTAVPERDAAGYSLKMHSKGVHHVERYNLFYLHPVTRAVIFTHEALTPTEVMERLLEGYAPRAGPSVWA